MINGLVVSDTQKSVADRQAADDHNAAVKHDVGGRPRAFGAEPVLHHAQKNAGLDKKFTALGKAVAGLGSLQDIKKGDPIRSIRITRVGQAARDFKTDDEAFNKLVPPAAKKK